MDGVRCGLSSLDLTLKADGIKVERDGAARSHDSSGNSTTLTMPAAIYDGEIDGSKISFKCQDPWSHDRAVTFTGIVNGAALN
jgi:hypothetical protein